MSSDEEYEKFDMDENDLKYAMNPNHKRSRMTKEGAMLGIWAEREFSDDESNDGFEGFNQKKRSKISDNIQFISGGVKGEKNSDESNNSDSNSDAENVNSLLDELNRKAAEREAEKKKKQDTRQKYKGKNKEGQAKDLGEWERHTKGIGMKLLQKMGWEAGKGIGKDLQGRVKPVEATVRKGKGAIGSYGNEGGDKNKNEEIEEEEQIVTKSKGKIQQTPQWRKTDQKKKPKYIIKTVDEVLSENVDNNLEYEANSFNKQKKIQSKPSVVSGMSTSKIKVIDMTGKDVKILQGYETFSKKKNNMIYEEDDEREEESEKSKQKKFDLPELLHNLELLVDMTEEKIVQSDKKLKYNEDMVLSMIHEDRRINEKIEEEKEHIDKIDSLYEFIQECETKIKSGNTKIDEVIQMFNTIKSDYYNEYKIYNLTELLIPLSIPIINKNYLNWNPFKSDNDQITLCYDLFKELKCLLEDSNSSTLSNSNAGYYQHRQRGQQNQQPIDTYHRLIWEAWMPHVRQALMNHNIRNCNNIVDFIDLWRLIVPQWIVDNILENIIMPKLTKEVDSWNPLADTVPIHVWLHPWLPLMSKSLDSLYGTIRHKLSNALQNWHPSDSSAKAILLPWKNVFTSTSWDIFMNNNILPKLEKCLIEFEINPRQQNIDAWKWVMDWEPLIPTNSFINLIDKVFFPKWLEVLCVWLNSKPNYEEVSRWYLGWKTLLSEKLSSNSNIKSKLSQGLLMMSKSSNGGIVSYNPQQQTIPTAIPSLMAGNLEAVQSKASQPETSAKVKIEKMAAEHNLLFLPQPNRFQEGKQIYRLGNINLYIDRNVIVYLSNGIWTPTLNINEIINNAI